MLIHGKKAVVIRPLDPERAVARGRELAAKRASKAEFDAMLDEQPYTYVGVLGHDMKVLDKHNNIIGEMQHGDSFCDPAGLRKRDIN